MYMRCFSVFFLCFGCSSLLSPENLYVVEPAKKKKERDIFEKGHFLAWLNHQKKKKTKKKVVERTSLQK